MGVKEKMIAELKEREDEAARLEAEEAAALAKMKVREEAKTEAAPQQTDAEKATEESQLRTEALEAARADLSVETGEEIDTIEKAEEQGKANTVKELEEERRVDADAHEKALAAAEEDARKMREAEEKAAQERQRAEAAE